MHYLWDLIQLGANPNPIVTLRNPSPAVFPPRGKVSHMLSSTNRIKVRHKRDVLALGVSQLRWWIGIHSATMPRCITFVTSFDSARLRARVENRLSPAVFRRCTKVTHTLSSTDRTKLRYIRDALALGVSQLR